MKERALELAAGEDDPRRARNVLREYLQHVLLRELFDVRLLESLVFHGGTALRILHGLPRFSEDLDFHVTDEARREFSLAPALTKIRRGLELAGYDISTRDRTEKTVQTSFVRFRGLLYEAELSPRPEENLSVKLEVDTNPPGDFGTESSFVSTYHPLSLIHHNRPSFLAGKLHALLQRAYVKGRDFFDLLFYLGRWSDVEPNLPYLQNALRQTGYLGPELTNETWPDIVSQKVEETDWNKVEADVRPFIEQPSDLPAFKKENLLNLLKRR